jgi:putative salt-induced outer membrane protein
MKPFCVLAMSLSVLILTQPLVSRAEIATLSNGDRITGSLADSDGKALTLKTSYAGDVKIQWSAIKDLAATKPIYVTTSDKKTISGSIAPNGSNLTVHTSSGQTVELPMAEIVAVRSEEGEIAYEKSLHPSWYQNWNGNATVGLALARGNSDTTDFDTALKLDRTTTKDHIGLYESSVYSTNGLPGGGVTANAIFAGARYDRNITERLFGFVAADFTSDELQGLNIREIYSGGLGWHFIRTSTTTFDLLGGVNYTHESYSGTPSPPTASLDRNLPGLTLGEVFLHKFGLSTTVSESAYYYPDLEAFSQYRFSFDASATTKINKWFGWQVSIGDRYVTNPPVINTKSNDLILSTGVNFSFSH